MAKYSSGAKAVRALTGVTGTLHRNNVQRLEDTWLTYQAVVLAGVSDADVAWDFSTPATFDESLFAYVPLLRAGHFSCEIAHFDFCVKCKRLVSLNTDGNIPAMADNDGFSAGEGQPSAVKRPAGAELGAAAKKLRHGAASGGLEQDEHYLHRCALIKKRAVLCGVCQSLLMDLTARKSRRSRCKKHSENGKASLEESEFMCLEVLEDDVQSDVQADV